MHITKIRHYNLKFSNIRWDISPEESAKELYTRWDGQAIAYFLGISFEEYAMMSKEKVLSTLRTLLELRYDCPFFESLLSMLSLKTQVNIPNFVLEDDAKKWLEAYCEHKIISYDVERSLTTERIVELFSCLVEKIIFGKETKDKIETLLRLGFKLDELICFNISIDDLKAYAEYLDNSSN